MRTEMAATEKQRKQRAKSVRQSSSFTLPRLRFIRKAHSVTYDESQSSAVVADDPKYKGQATCQRTSVSDDAGEILSHKPGKS